MVFKIGEILTNPQERGQKFILVRQGDDIIFYAQDKNFNGRSIQHKDIASRLGFSIYRGEDVQGGGLVELTDENYAAGPYRRIENPTIVRLYDRSMHYGCFKNSDIEPEKILEAYKVFHPALQKVSLNEEE